MSELFEIIMLLCFGASWPVNLSKAWKSRTAKGQSLLFLCLIDIGYVAGIAAKLLSKSYMAEFSQKWYVLCFYILNLVMVSLDIIVYFRNRRLDAKNGKNC